MKLLLLFLLTSCCTKVSKDYVLTVPASGIYVCKDIK
jgi:hypothetical protein